MVRLEIVALILISFVVAAFAALPYEDAIGLSVLGVPSLAGLAMFFGPFIPGRVGVYMRMVFLSAPSNSNARAWNAYDDDYSNLRRDRRWNDEKHKWDKRTVYFTDAEEEARYREGRWSPADRSV